MDLTIFKVLVGLKIEYIYILPDGMVLERSGDKTLNTN